jgi:hypothetical protein
MPGGSVVTEEDQEAIDLLDVGVVIRSAYIISHIDKFLEIIEKSETIRHSLPREYRDIFRGEDGAALTRETATRISYDFAKHPESVINSIKKMVLEIRQYVGVWADGEDEGDEPCLFGMLEYNDMRVIEEMITFTQKVGTRSTRQLLNFLEAVNDGEFAYLVVKGKNRDSEVVMRHRISDSAKSEFGIE